MKVRTALVMTAMASLIGCTTTAKPELTEVGYNQYATWLAGGELCALRGYVQPELAAYGKVRLGYQLAGYSFNPEQLNAQVASKLAAATSAEPTREECGAMALRIAEMKQRYAANMADGAEQQQAEYQMLEMLRTNTPRTAYCNKYGTETLCTAY